MHRITARIEADDDSAPRTWSGGTRRVRWVARLSLVSSLALALLLGVGSSCAQPSSQDSAASSSAGTGSVANAPRVASGQRSATPKRGSVQVDRYFFELAQEEVEFAYFLPPSYSASSATKAPLIILLHGLRSTPQQVIRYDGILEQAAKRGYVVVAPFGYNDRGWYGSLGKGVPRIPGYDRPLSRPDDPANLGELSEEDVWNVLERARERFNVDPERTYLMGHSMGGGGSLYLAMERPELFAAVAPLAPAIYGDPTRIRSMQDVPVIIVQGDNDRLVRVENTRRWVEEIRSLGMTHRYIEIPGGDHVRSIARNPDMIEDVFDFFDAHRRGDTARGS